MQCGDNWPVRERQRPLPERLCCDVVAQFGTQLHEFASCSCQSLDGDQMPVTVSMWNPDSIDRGSVTLSLRLTFCGALRF